jgi:hypothetical protein
LQLFHALAFCKLIQHCSKQNKYYIGGANRRSKGGFIIKRANPAGSKQGSLRPVFNLQAIQKALQ